MAQLTFNASEDSFIDTFDAAYVNPPGIIGGHDTTSILVYIGRTITDGYHIRNGFVAFDTSGLPDTAVITGATLRIFVEYRWSDNTKMMKAEWYPTFAGTSADWTFNGGNNAIAGVDIASMAVTQDVDFALSNADANISRTGTTRLRIDATDNNAPTGAGNEVRFSSIESTTNPEARLIVDYQVGASTPLAPDAILAQTNLTGAVGNIQDDPDSPDANWLVAP